MLVLFLNLYLVYIYQLLKLYKDFDEDCFPAYIDYALKEDSVRGGVTLTISREDEVAIFRKNPSWWWLPMPKPKKKVSAGGHAKKNKKKSMRTHARPQKS